MWGPRHGHVILKSEACYNEQMRFKCVHIVFVSVDKCGLEICNFTVKLSFSIQVSFISMQNFKTVGVMINADL